MANKERKSVQYHEIWYFDVLMRCEPLQLDLSPEAWVDHGLRGIC